MMGEVVPWEWESVLFGSSSSSSSSTTAPSCFDLPNNNNNLLGFRNSSDFLSSLPQHHYSMEDERNYFTSSLDRLEFPTGYLEDALLELCHPAAASASKRRRYENSAQNFHALATAAAATASYGGSGGLLFSSQRQEMTISSPPEMIDYYNIPSSSSSHLYNRSVSPVSSDYTNPVSVVVDDEVRDHSGSSSNSALASSDQLPHSSWPKREIDVKEEDTDGNEEKERKQRTKIMKKTGGDGGEERQGRRRKREDRVTYPFTLVKPGGREGEVTIEEINKRILMTPTRPVRHPVGKYACRPCVSSTSSAAVAGLSGKAVVALTRIYTQGGKGTVTIIRTKG